MFALQGFDDAARRQQSRLPAGRRGARPEMGPRELSVQYHHRRHREGRRAPDRRRQSAPRGGGAQCAHPQALARRPRAFRSASSARRRRSDLPLRLSRRRARDARRYRDVTASPKRCARPSGRCHRRRGRARAAGRRGASASLAAKAAIALGAVNEGWNGFSVLHSAAARVGALDLGFVPGEGGLTARQMAASGALDVLFLLGADEIEIAPGAFVVYIGTHGDRGAHSRRRDPAGRGLYRESRPSTSTPKAGCRWRRAPRSRPAMRARTGRSCARCRTCSASGCPTTRSRSCAQALFKAASAPRCASATIAPGDAADIEKLAAPAAPCDKAPFALEHRRLLSHQSDRARFRRHGRVLGDRAGRTRDNGGGVGA